MSIYSEKLKNPKWQKKRLEIMERDEWKCKICQDSENELVVHHKRYLKDLEPWEYDKNDLITLCVNCHEKEHSVLDSFLVSRGIDEFVTNIDEKTICIHSGLKSLDKIIGGFQKGEVITLASAPSVGKTALALKIANNIAVENKIPVAYFSLEMSSSQLSMRLLASEGKINLNKIKKNELNRIDFENLHSAALKIYDSNIFIDSSFDLSISKITRIVRNLRVEKNIGIVFIDNIQLFAFNKNDRFGITSQLKRIAKENDIPVIVLSQLDRQLEKRADKRPVLSDFYENDIVHNSDIVMFLYRDEIYNKEESNPNIGIAELTVAKQRNGPLGVVNLIFLSKYTSFEEMDYDYD
ncbi:MAG: DnaB-like helicase C-terminal domain-containing protein [Desulfobacteraceae bacterium]|jgi:replicative DNA helicase